MHSMLAGQADACGCQARYGPAHRADVPRQCLGVVFCAPMVGAKLVMPGAKLDGASVCELLETREGRR